MNWRGDRRQVAGPPHALFHYVARTPLLKLIALVCKKKTSMHHRHQLGRVVQGGWSSGLETLPSPPEWPHETRTSLDIRRYRPRQKLPAATALNWQPESCKSLLGGRLAGVSVRSRAAQLLHWELFERKLRAHRCGLCPNDSPETLFQRLLRVLSTAEAWAHRRHAPPLF